MVDKVNILRELQAIPGVGPNNARHLWEAGIRSVRQLRTTNADEIYRKACRRRGEKLDRCLLYVFRCAVYYASRDEHDPELLKWWNWKDRDHRGTM